MSLAAADLGPAGARVQVRGACDDYVGDDRIGDGCVGGCGTVSARVRVREGPAWATIADTITTDAATTDAIISKSQSPALPPSSAHYPPTCLAC